jgi:phage N-6-adenine-methyltransferase
MSEGQKWDPGSGLFSTAKHDGDGSDEWATPSWLWRPLDRAVGGFDLDPAAGCEPTPIGVERYTPEDDGLSTPWYGDVWVNPPYSDNKEWVPHARDESLRDEVRSVFLLIPARTDTRYWHDVHGDASAICFVKGRVDFIGDGGDSGAPFPVALLAFGDVPDEAVYAMASYGEVVTPVNTTLTEQLTLQEAGDGGDA